MDIYSKRYQKYCEKEEEFLNVLELNKKEWEVLYTPYSRRFFELYLKDVPEEIKKRMRSQMNPAEMRSRGTHVIENDGTILQLQERVDALLEGIT